MWVTVLTELSCGWNHATELSRDRSHNNYCARVIWVTKVSYPRIVSPVLCHYTDWAIPSPIIAPSLTSSASHRTTTEDHIGSAPTQWWCTPTNSNTITPTDDKFFKKQQMNVMTCINTRTAESRYLVAFFFFFFGVLPLWNCVTCSVCQKHQMLKHVSASR